MAVKPLKLPDAPLDPVSCYRVSCFPRDCYPETGSWQAIVHGKDDEIAPPHLLSRALNLQIVCTRPHSYRTGKPEVQVPPYQTVSRFLPLARLLFRINRPPLVFMRSLNPCVLFLEMLLG